jgi:cell division protein FtsB
MKTKNIIITIIFLGIVWFLIQYFTQPTVENMNQDDTYQVTEMSNEDPEALMADIDATMEQEQEINAEIDELDNLSF